MPTVPEILAPQKISVENSHTRFQIPFLFSFLKNRPCSSLFLELADYIKQKIEECLRRTHHGNTATAWCGLISNPGIFYQQFMFFINHIKYFSIPSSPTLTAKKKSLDSSVVIPRSFLINTLQRPNYSLIHLNSIFLFLFHTFLCLILAYCIACWFLACV